MPASKVNISAPNRTQNLSHHSVSCRPLCSYAPCSWQVVQAPGWRRLERLVRGTRLASPCVILRAYPPPPLYPVRVHPTWPRPLTNLMMMGGDCVTASQVLLSPPPPRAVAPSVSSNVCDWAQAVRCEYPNMKPSLCQRDGCEILMHHL